jgi:hypothetical protein
MTPLKRIEALEKRVRELRHEQVKIIASYSALRFELVSALGRLTKAAALIEGTTEAAALRRTWMRRPCFICQQIGACEHREAQMDIAEIQAGRDAVRGRRTA